MTMFTRHDNGEVTVNEWDGKTPIDGALFASKYIHKHGDTVTIHVSNGKATYKIDSYDPVQDRYYCQLVSGELKL